MDTKGRQPEMFLTSKSANLHSRSGIQKASLIKGRTDSGSSTGSDEGISMSPASPGSSNQSAKRVLGIQVQSFNQRHLYKTNDVTQTDSTNQLQLVGSKLTNGTASTQTNTTAVNGYTPPGSEIPPCKVCGDKASGLHYGVYTCEACKAFFRRTLKRANTDFTCMCTGEDKKLGSDVARKTTCPKCRYERCIKVGMSKDAIKIGRYTINRKRQNDREVNQIKVKDTKAGPVTNRRISDSSSKSGSSLSPGYSSGQGVSSPDDSSNDTTTLPQTDTQTDTQMDTQGQSRKRKSETQGGQPESGLLFKSLTNSIFQSLLENQLTNVTAGLSSLKPTETSAMEQLYMEPFTTKQQTSPSMLTQQQQQQQQQLYNTDLINQAMPPPIEDNECESELLQNGVFPDQSQFIALQNADSLNPLNLQNQLLLSPLQNTDQPSIEELLLEPGTGLPNYGVEDEVLYLDQVPKIDQSLLEVGLGNPIALVNCCDEEISEFDENLFTATKLNEYAEADLADLEQLIMECEEDNCEDCGVGRFENTHLDLDHQLKEFDCYQDCCRSRCLVPGVDISLDDITDIVRDLTLGTKELVTKRLNIPCDEIKKRHADYLEQYNLKMKTFGNMSNISTEEYLTFYNQTGIDIDNRQEILIEGLKHLEESVQKMIAFSKRISGFEDLLIDDQVNLVKASRFKQLMINIVPSGVCVKTHMHVTTLPWNKTYHIDEIKKIFPMEYLEAKMECATNIYKLHLSIEEVSALKAMVITFPYQCELKQKDKVSVIHERMVACFKYLLNSRTKYRHITFKHVVHVLLGLHELGKWDQRVMQEVFEIWPVSKNHPELKQFVTT